MRRVARIRIRAGPDLIPAIGTPTIAERRSAEPLLSARRPAALAVALLPVRRLGVVVCGLGADVGGDANMVGGAGFAPDIALDAGVRAVRAAVGRAAARGSGVVGGGLRTCRWRDADVVVGEGFAPDVAWMKVSGLALWEWDLATYLGRRCRGRSHSRRRQ